jgi:hypothetical protein
MKPVGVARMGEDRKIHKVLVENPGGKSSLGRSMHRWGTGANGS